MSLRLRAEKKEELLMKILIYGAGVIGSLYAVYFSHAGYSVSVIAAVLPLVYRSSFGSRFMYQHAMKAREEMQVLHSQFYSFIKNEVL